MKNKIITYSFTLFLILFLILNIVFKDNIISLNERRKLTLFPTISISNIISGEFMDKFEEYTLDQFPFRDTFRSIKTYISLYLFNKSDSNKLFVKDGYIYKMDYPLNNKSVDNFITKFNNIKNKYLINNNVYLSIIPDKNYFLDDKYLKIDYNELIDKTATSIDAKYIDIIPYLSIDDYYKTDTHWRQECITYISKKLLSEMNNNNNDIKYEEITYNNFYGVYYGQLGLKINGEDLIYLTNDIIESSSVYNLENDFNKVYNTSKLNGMDNYDLFLSGASSYIEITNNNSLSDKNLIIFRDSFGSSIAPLMLENYFKITLIDMRYIDTANLEKLITFDNQDVLILYSTMLINNSFTIKN